MKVKELIKKTKTMIQINETDKINILFCDGEDVATASIPYERLKELLMDEAYEIITTPECRCSSCAENGFCECDPINEDMEFAGIYLDFGKK